MKKAIISTAIILVVMIFVGLIFDWGRREVKLSETNQSSSTTQITQSDFFSTSSMPIVVSYPVENQEVSNPIKIEGKARGNWFFEGSFPIQLVDTNGNIVTSTIATAQGEWMTADFVNFTASIEYNKASSTKHALIVLNKDNPSGNPDFDQSIFIPVILK